MTIKSDKPSISKEAKPETKPVTIGDPNLYTVISEVYYEKLGLTQITKALYIHGNGVVMVVTSCLGKTALSDAITFIPGAMIITNEKGFKQIVNRP